MKSLKVGILIASATEGQVERKLELVLENSRSARNSRSELKAVHESRVESLHEDSLRISALTYLHRRAVQTTLLYVCSDKGGLILVLSKGSASSLIGRTITTNVIDRRGSPIVRDAGPIPSVTSHDTIIGINRRLPERHDLHANSINLHLVKQPSNSVILRYGTKHTQRSKMTRSSYVTDRDDQLSIDTVFQAEPGNVSLA